jgi:hypothetical protein
MAIKNNGTLDMAHIPNYGPYPLVDEHGEEM